jgi:hypothetical protein
MAFAPHSQGNSEKAYDRLRRQPFIEVKRSKAPWKEIKAKVAAALAERAEVLL